MPERKQGKNGTYLDLYPGSTYDPTVFERPTLTVDLCILRIFEGKLQILLIERGQNPYKGCLAFPGGYVDIVKLESSDEAAYRELKEETGVDNLAGPIKQFRAYANSLRDPRWYTTDIVYYYIASREEASRIEAVAGDDAAAVHWVDAREALRGTLAFDHARILEDLLDHLQASVWNYEVLFRFGQLPSGEFTLPDLYAVYTAVTGMQSLGLSNFSKKLRVRYRITKSYEKLEHAGPGRPPAVYRLL